VTVIHATNAPLQVYTAVLQAGQCLGLIFRPKCALQPGHRQKFK